MHARAIVSDGAQPLMEAWHLSVTQKDLVIGQLASAVGPGGARPRLPSLGADRAPVSGPRPERQAFQHGVHLFLGAIAQGLALPDPLRAFLVLDTGAYSHDDRCFYPDSPVLGTLADRSAILGGA